MKVLLSSGAAVNRKDKEGMTALHWAAEAVDYADSAHIIAELLGCGADLRATMTTGNGPLEQHLAICSSERCDGGVPAMIAALKGKPFDGLACTLKAAVDARKKETVRASTEAEAAEAAATAAADAEEAKAEREAAEKAAREEVEREEKETAQESAACGVCGDGASSVDDQIVFCAGRGCNVAVHQSCYRIGALPEGEWHCDECRAGHAEAGKSTCELCGLTQEAGAERGRWWSARPLMHCVLPGKAESLVHVVCAELNAEVEIEVRGGGGASATWSFDDRKHMQRRHKKLDCRLCGEPGGVCIQCARPKCPMGMHPVCAADAKLLGHAKNGGWEAFCESHVPDFDYGEWDRENPEEVAAAVTSRHDELLQVAFAAGKQLLPLARALFDRKVRRLSLDAMRHHPPSPSVSAAAGGAPSLMHLVATQKPVGRGAEAATTQAVCLLLHHTTSKPMAANDGVCATCEEQEPPSNTASGSCSSSGSRASSLQQPDADAPMLARLWLRRCSPECTAFQTSSGLTLAAFDACCHSPFAAALAAGHIERAFAIHCYSISGAPPQRHGSEDA